MIGDIDNSKFSCERAEVQDWPHPTKLGLGFYIVADVNDWKWYVHKDGKVRDGASYRGKDTGWFKTREEAEAVLQKAKERFCGEKAN